MKGNETNWSAYSIGLEAAIEIAEWRLRNITAICGKPNPNFVAGIEEVLVFLRAAQLRASKGENYRSQSTTMS